MAIALPAEKGATAAGRRFAEWARAHTDVAAIVAVPLSGSVSIWTVLRDAQSDTRRALYDLQVRTWEDFPDEPVTFRIIDLAEFPDTPPAELLPPSGQRLFVAPAAGL